MTDREALAAALDVFFAKRNAKEWDTLEAAARERLAQLERPEDFCPHESCPICRQIARNTA